MNRERIKNSLIFFTIFAFLGKIIPELYYQYWDTTKYYTVSEARVTNEPQPCGNANLLITRKSLIDSNGKIIRILIHIDSAYRFARVVDNVPLGSTEETIPSKQPVPCDAPIGTYIYETILEYNIRNIPKTYIYHSDPFEITN